MVGGPQLLSKSAITYTFEGDAEIVAYNRVLPAGELNQVGAYLAAKWAVPWSPVSSLPRLW